MRESARIAALTVMLMGGLAWADGKPACTGTFEETSDHAGGSEAEVWSHGPHTILISWRGHGQHGAPYGSDTLWLVDCRAPAKREVFVQVEGADFGHGVMTPDGATLYFAGSSGVEALDLASKRIRIVTKPLTTATCGAMANEEHPRQLRDTPYALEGDVLSIKRGGPCGSSGNWTDVELRLEHPDHPGTPRVVRPTKAVAVDAAGTIWLGAYGCMGGLWTSDDHGGHWRPVAMPYGQDGASAIYPDHRRAGSVVLVSSCGQSYAGDPDGGAIFLTRDGGKSWNALPLPAGVAVEHPRSTDTLVVAVRDGSIDHLELWAMVRDDPTDDRNARVARWLTHDAGQTWKEIATAGEAPAMSTAQATLSGETFTTSDDGLVVTRKGAYVRRVYPARRAGSISSSTSSNAARTSDGSPPP